MTLLRDWGEECYGARDGASSLPIYLPLRIAAIYAGSATRNCNQKCKRQDLADKKSRNWKTKTRNYIFMYILIHKLEWLELLPCMNSRKQEFKEYSVESQMPSNGKQDLVLTYISQHTCSIEINQGSSHFVHE